MAVDGVNGSSSTPKVVSKDQIGLNGVTSDVFMKLLIEQLKNQDPTEPVGNDQLLNQLSSMRALQANVELTDTLKTFGTNQQISAGASLIGKFVIGTDDNNANVYGVADHVTVKDGSAYVGWGETEIPMKNISGVYPVTS